jgi:hypothetical protein
VAHLFAALARLGFAGWFGAGAWFGLFGAPAALRHGFAAALAVLFPPLFWYGVGCGVAALVGTVTPSRDGRRAVRAALAAAVLAGALAEAAVLDPLVHRAAAGAGNFSAAHTASLAIALVSWGAALLGLLLTG